MRGMTASRLGLTLAVSNPPLDGAALCDVSFAFSFFALLISDAGRNGEPPILKADIVTSSSLVIPSTLYNDLTLENLTLATKIIFS
jgi:hypothetical protein